MIAVRCGAERVLAVDNDPISVSAAAVNVALNAMQDRIVVREGSAEIAPERFDWVVANINTPILHELLHQLVSAARPGGRIVLSGLLEEDAPGLIRSACSLGVELVCERRNAEWALLCFKHEPFKRGSGRRK
jgi:ribosomal protein L11 methyltransferase